jgi:leucyl-tRNA synthetase
MVVFTTRPDTLWGATFMVLAPEHPLVDKLTTSEHREEVEAYRYQASRQSEIDRMAVDKEKTGVFIGAYAINPVNDARIPIWIADYVLMTYGTGAIMAVPAHDERDFEFAIKYGLSIIPVIDRPDGVAKSLAMQGTMKEGFTEALMEASIPFEEREGSLYVTMDRDQVDRYVALVQEFIQPGSWTEVVGARWAFIFDDGVVEFGGVEADRAILARCHELEPAVGDKRTVMELLDAQPFYRDVLFHAEYDTMINSGPLTGTPGDQAVQRTTKWLAERDAGKFAVNYRLRDWLISRQRYWGVPIPIVYCPSCGTVPVPEEDLPVLLPEDAEFLPTGESPLKYHETFRHTTCPQCGGPAERETDTMDTFMCSSWYQWRYLSPHYDEGPFDPREATYWLPVDLYTGGIEHATMHLIYTRFFTKVCRDMGLVDHDEPMLKLHNQGIILGEDSEKMSKSRGNVVDPDDLVQQYGADTVRTYLMFIGPWEDGGPWNSRGIEGVSRFYNRVWALVQDPGVLEPTSASEEQANEKGVADLRRITHKTIRKVTEDLETFRFNTMVAALMEFNNYLVKARTTPVAHTPAWDEAIETLLLLLAPSAPHITEELWARLGKSYSIHQQPWPQWDEALAADEVITLPVQVNGKVRARLQVPADVTEEQARELALADERVQRHIAGKQVKKVIYVPGRLVNIVARYE